MIIKFITVLCLLIGSVSAVVYNEPPEGFQARFEIAACFLENNGRILVLHRLENKSQGNTWGIPGGKVDKGENTIAAVVREVKEETGIELNPSQVKPIRSLYITNTVRNKVSYIYHMFRADYNEKLDIAINPNEHKGFTWVTPCDALTMQLMDDEPECIELVYKGQI